MRKVILYGELANRFGREHHLSVNNASEAIQAFCVNFPGFKDLVRNAHKYGIGFKVFVGGSPLQREKDAKLPSSSSQDIKIVPAIFGSGGWAKTLIGAVLIVGGVVVSGATFGGASPIGGAMISAGIGLVLNGVYQLLTSPPDANSDANSADVNNQSFIFSGPENVTQQGGGVPIGYGRMMIGSTVISAGIEDVDQ